MDDSVESQPLGDCFLCLLNPVWQMVLTRSLWQPRRRSLGSWVMPGSPLLSTARGWTSLLPELMDHCGGTGPISLPRALCWDASVKSVVPTSFPNEHLVLSSAACWLSQRLLGCCPRLPYLPLLLRIHAVLWGASGLVVFPMCLGADRILAQTLTVSFILLWIAQKLQ